MTGSVAYGTIETLNIAISANDDVFTIETTHSNVTDAGSGAIITGAERTAISNKVDKNIIDF